MEFLKNRRTGEKFKLAEMISPFWHNIGTRLGLHANLLDSIMDDHGDNIGQLRGVLNQWFGNASGLEHGDLYPLSWKGLHALLDDIDQEEIAKNYFKFLDEMH